MIELFNSKLLDTVNQAHQIDESYAQEKFVSKALRSLPERFKAKVTAIDEAKDVSTMKLDELIGSSQAYEMTIPTRQHE